MFDQMEVILGNYGHQQETKQDPEIPKIDGTRKQVITTGNGETVVRPPIQKNNLLTLPTKSEE